MSKGSIEIKYNEDFRKLEELLGGVQRPGEFFVSGKLEIPMPKLEVEGVGILSFPVPETQIAQLISRAVRAPYGRGEETILDESVRRVWQLGPGQVRIGGGSWAGNFERILRQVAAGLGCEGVAVAANLYKLLVYDTGGFFLSHRDTEKEAGMFGTLVVVLPSAHEGGELVIRHAGREVAVDMGSSEISEVSFAAFYADCEHEVKPITRGNRVCLVYNLVQKPSENTEGPALRAPDFGEQIAAAAALLKENLPERDAPAKIAWLLEHQYSPDGLSFEGLKAADAARANVLRKAAQRAGCAAHLGIVHIEESGAAELGYEEYRSRRHRWSGSGGCEDKESSDFEVIEVSDRRHYISEWRGANDAPVDFGEIPLEPGELLPTGSLEGEDPDEQRVMEATGNEGASFERSYRRAALVIWREDRTADVLLQAGVDAVLPHLEKRIRVACSAGAPDSVRREAVALARGVVGRWKEAQAAPVYWRPPRPVKRGAMLRLLMDLGETALLRAFIEESVAPDYDGSENGELETAALKLGATDAGGVIASLMRSRAVEFPKPCVDLLCALVSSRAPGAKEWRDAVCQMAEGIVNSLSEMTPKRREYLWVERAPSEPPLNAALVARLLNALIDLKAPELIEAASKKLVSNSIVFDPVAVLTPALSKIRRWEDAGTTVWEACVRFLLDRSGIPPEAPADWRQNVIVDCGCEDCRELMAFAHDPVEVTCRFRIRADRRSHLESQIVRHHMDMSHVTERKGSPQSLICTKNRRSYQVRCEEYRNDIAALAELAKWPGAVRVRLKKIEAACGAAAGWSPASS